MDKLDSIIKLIEDKIDILMDTYSDISEGDSSINTQVQRAEVLGGVTTLYELRNDIKIIQSKDD